MGVQKARKLYSWLNQFLGEAPSLRFFSLYLDPFNGGRSSGLLGRGLDSLWLGKRPIEKF
jgi:hypothetical protein